MKNIFIFFLLLSNTILWGTDFIGWNEVKTEHFTYIFEDFDEKTAFELAGYGEEIYEIVTDFFDFYPKHITIYINSRFDSPNGNFYPLPGSIDLFPVYPLNSENSTKSSSWLYELFLHEMVHYVNLEKPIGFFGGLSRVFGKDLASANGAFLPAWLVEGIAVYLETKYTDGGRGENLYFEAFTKTAAWEKDYFSLNQLAYSSDFPPYNRIYSGGYVLVKFMMETFGEDIFNSIYNRYARFPFFGPFHAVKKETGYSLQEIFTQMKQAQMDRYAESFSESEEYTSEVLSSEGISDRIHPIHTDKGILAYRRTHKGPPSIILVDRDTGEEEVVIESALIEGSSFSADKSGNKIVFATGEYGLYNSFGYSLISDLFISEDGEVRRLSDGKSLFQPALSPDGQNLIAVQRKGSYSILVSVDLESGKVDELYSEEMINIMNPQFSPQGDEILFTVNERGYQDIYLMEVAEPFRASPLFNQDRASDYHGRFDGADYITFISDRDGTLSLYSYDRKSNEVSLLFKDPVGVADGFLLNGKIYYQAYRTGGYQLRTGLVDSENDIIETAWEHPPREIEIAPIEKSRHFDLAIPYLWLPKPYVQISASGDWLWGGGAAVFAGSYSQSTEWLLDLNYLHAPGQVAGSFDYDRKIGSTTFSYTLNQSFDEVLMGSTYLWNQETDQSIIFSYPLFESGFVNRRHVLKNYLFVRHRLSILENSNFSIIDSFSLNADNLLYIGSGLSHSIYKINNARTALFGGLSLTNQMDFSLLLPILSATNTSYIIKESGSLTLPLSQRGTNLQTAWEAAYHNKGISSSAVSARGWAAELTPSDFSFYYTSALQIPLALVDWALPQGFNIQNLAMALNLEGISHLQFDGTGESQFFASLELIGTYGYNYGSTPFGAGVSFRFYDGGLAFDPTEDIRIYFFLSFNSL